MELFLHLICLHAMMLHEVQWHFTFKMAIYKKRFQMNFFLRRNSSLYSFFFFLRLYSPIQALAASIKLSVSLQLLDLGQSVGLLGLVISSSQVLYLYTYTEKHTHNIHALSGIRIHGPGVRASERSSCLRPIGHVTGTVFITLHGN
jgi:hypothetical protein